MMVFGPTSLARLVPVVGATKRRILLELRRNRLHGYALAARLRLPLNGIYDHLRQLAQEGFVVHAEAGRRKVYSLTAKGSKLAEALREKASPPAATLQRRRIGERAVDRSRLTARPRIGRRHLQTPPARDPPGPPAARCL